MAIVSVEDGAFEEAVLKASEPVLVDFYAEWCGPCRALSPKLEELSNEMSDVKIAKIDIDSNPNTPAQYGVKSIPTLILFKGGEKVGELLGNQTKEAITDLIKQHS